MIINHHYRVAVIDKISTSAFNHLNTSIITITEQITDDKM